MRRSTLREKRKAAARKAWDTRRRVAAAARAARLSMIARKAWATRRLTQPWRPRYKPTPCDCPAPLQVFGKRFPHRPGGVSGCHMDPETGSARDYIVRCDPYHLCRACLDAADVIQSVYDQDMDQPIDCFGNRGA